MGLDCYWVYIMSVPILPPARLCNKILQASCRDTVCADIPGRDTYEALSREEDKLSYGANGVRSLLTHQDLDMECTHAPFF